MVHHIGHQIQHREQMAVGLRGRAAGDAIAQVGHQQAADDDFIDARAIESRQFQRKEDAVAAMHPHQHQQAVPAGRVLHDLVREAATPCPRHRRFGAGRINVQRPWRRRLRARPDDHGACRQVLRRHLDQDRVARLAELSNQFRIRVEIALGVRLRQDLSNPVNQGQRIHLGLAAENGADRCISHQLTSTLALMPGRIFVLLLSKTTRASIRPLAGSAAGDTKL